MKAVIDYKASAMPENISQTLLDAAGNLLTEIDSVSVLKLFNICCLPDIDGIVFPVCSDIMSS
ncbi:MAG: hypothetical protein KAT04_14890 [Methylococcales bacterium]|nr:hypothetical protein [Methylococcales bacterium]